MKDAALSPKSKYLHSVISVFLCAV